MAITFFVQASFVSMATRCSRTMTWHFLLLSSGCINLSTTEQYKKICNKDYLSFRK